MTLNPSFKIGDRVERRSDAGPHWTGVIVSAFWTRSGDVRYVVERDDQTLHIHQYTHMREASR